MREGITNTTLSKPIYSLELASAPARLDVASAMDMLFNQVCRPTWDREAILTIVGRARCRPGPNCARANFGVAAMRPPKRSQAPAASPS